MDRSDDRQLRSLAEALGAEVSEASASHLSESAYWTLSRGDASVEVRVSGHEQRPTYWRPIDVEIGAHDDAHAPDVAGAARRIARALGLRSSAADGWLAERARRGRAASRAADTRWRRIEERERAAAAAVAERVRGGGRWTAADLRGACAGAAGVDGRPAVLRTLGLLRGLLAADAGAAELTAAALGPRRPAGAPRTRPCDACGSADGKRRYYAPGWYHDACRGGTR